MKQRKKQKSQEKCPEKNNFEKNTLYKMEKKVEMKKNHSQMSMIGLGLFLEKEKTLIIGDLQLGYEENLNRQGILVPRTNCKQILEQLNEIIKETGKLEKIIINGDLKHEFERVSEQEWSEVIDVLRFLEKHAREVVLVKGNHDVFLGPIADWEKLKVVEQYYIPSERLLVLHGHKIPDTSNEEFKQAKIVIIGHEHSAIALQEGETRHTFKCFLKGKWKDKTVIVVPSLNALTKGNNILNEKPLSPFLKENLQEFEVWAVEDTVYYFGKIKELMEKQAG